MRNAAWPDLAAVHNKGKDMRKNSGQTKSASRAFVCGLQVNPDAWRNYSRQNAQREAPAERASALECLEKLAQAVAGSQEYQTAFEAFDAAQSRLGLDEARAVVQEAMNYCTPEDQAHLRNVLEDIAYLKGDIRHAPLQQRTKPDAQKNVVPLVIKPEKPSHQRMDFAAS